MITKSRIFSSGNVFFCRFCSESGTGSSQKPGTAALITVFRETCIRAISTYLNCSGAPGCGVQHRRYRPHPLLSRSQNRGRGQLKTEEEKEGNLPTISSIFILPTVYGTAIFLYTKYQCCPIKRHIFSDIDIAGDNGRELKVLILAVQTWSADQYGTVGGSRASGHVRQPWLI